jgi:flagellar hook-associated protein 2
VGLNGETDEGDLVTVTRNSNTFDLDGTVITLNKKADADAAKNVTIDVSLDTDALAEKITDFITDYNALLELINGKLNEKKYSGFLPLTDDEKENLTENEQNTWTEKAKSGLLRNDIFLQGIVSSLRSSLYTSVSSLTSSRRGHRSDSFGYRHHHGNLYRKRQARDRQRQNSVRR